MHALPISGIRERLARKTRSYYFTIRYLFDRDRTYVPSVYITQIEFKDRLSIYIKIVCPNAIKTSLFKANVHSAAT